MDGYRLADYARLQPLLALPEQREQAQHLPHHQHAPCLLRRLQQRVAVFHRERERFLAEKMLPAL
jgi:hypothetical protein